MLGIEVTKEAVDNQEGANRVMAHLLDTAHVSAVFGEPVTQGDYTAITASEMSIGMGFGYGIGGGAGPEEVAGEEGGGETAVTGGYGGGGGGGGAVSARPVAVVEIGPHGVRVEPIVDPTKIALAFFAAVGSLVMMLSKMKKASE